MFLFIYLIFIVKSNMKTFICFNIFVFFSRTKHSDGREVCGSFKRYDIDLMGRIARKWGILCLKKLLEVLWVKVRIPTEKTSLLCIETPHSLFISLFISTWFFAFQCYPNFCFIYIYIHIYFNVRGTSNSNNVFVRVYDIYCGCKSYNLWILGKLVV